MKVAIISDIHSNLPALESVLADARQFDVTVCCGDVVGYYSNPNEVVELIRDHGIATIRGNHDAFAIGVITPDGNRDHFYRVTWTRSELRSENLSWLRCLPMEIRLRWDSCTLLLRHASPWDETTYLYPDSPRLSEIQLDARNVLAVGHTHRPFVRPVGNGLLVNPGSVGQPRGENLLPTYGVLDVETQTFEHRRVHYDVATYQNYLKGLGWDEKAVGMLAAGKIV